MPSTTLSKKIKNYLPSKNIFITIVFLILSITISSLVVLANESVVVVEADVLNVRYGPGLSHDILTTAKEDDQLHVLGEQNKWYKVRLGNDNIGWVASWLVDNKKLINENQKFVQVNSEAVNIREFANTDSKILGVVREDTELQVLYEDGDWYQVLYMGEVSWIHKAYTEIIDKNRTRERETTTNSLVQVGNHKTNVRSAPSLESEIIYLSKPNEKFTYLETVDDWYHVEIDDDRSAYISSSVSTIEDETSDEQPEIDSPKNQEMIKANSLAEATIVVDAGHGGNDPGAISANQSIYEKDLALNTAILLKNRLKDAGSNVILTREQDTSVSLSNRVAISHENNADAFISLHYDAVDEANTMSGTTTYYQIDKHLELAQTVNKYLKNQGPLPNNGVRLADYKVLRENKQPAILLELGYMNHRNDTQLINDSSYQAAIVEAIYQALNEYYCN